MKKSVFEDKLLKYKLIEGFTLIELLLAILISGFVVSAIGVGLVVMTRGNTASEAKTQARVELNRALDFMAEEIRMASSINTQTVTLTAPTDTVSGTDQIILRLTIPNVTGGPVVYRIAQPNTSSVWQGPRAIYRWGPNMDANGQYTDPAVTTNWQNRLLIDGISDVTQTPNCGTETLTPASNVRGFYACI
jgi:type II secretory pathway pseudopilin PulG